MKCVACLIALLVWNVAGAVSALDEAAIMQELESLKQRVEELEAKIERQAVQGKEEGYAQEKAELSSIKEKILERLGTLEIHGAVVGYYQGMNEPEIGGRGFDNANGAGYVADLEMSFEPVENGEFYLRLHAGEGDGADRDTEGAALFADVNTLNDDNPDGQFLDLLEAFYTQSFLDDRMFIAAGKTEPVVFIDDNAYANDEYTQFIGKPFVNDPVLDSEDEFGPLVALGFSPWKRVSLMVLGQSSSHADQKDIWDEVFDQPFVAGQLTYTPSFGGLAGNYRLYGWSATYDHATLTDASEGDKGWGVGLSVDQRVHARAGLFGRLGYHNEEVYPVDWFWSIGGNVRGLLPGRRADELGIGIAGLHANDKLGELDPAFDTDLLLGDPDGFEYHFEAYYRIVFNDCVAVTPHLQYVLAPLADDSNEDIVVGTVRTELGF